MPDPTRQRLAPIPERVVRSVRNRMRSHSALSAHPTVDRVEWRITYFVNRASRSLEGWTVEGEPGLGPPEVGDEFRFVLHQDTETEDQVNLRVEKFDGSSMLVSGGDEIELRVGDIIGGVVERHG